MNTKYDLTIGDLQDIELVLVEDPGTRGQWPSQRCAGPDARDADICEKCKVVKSRRLRCWVTASDYCWPSPRKLISSQGCASSDFCS